MPKFLRLDGPGNVWTEDGRLVATSTQDNLIRTFPDRRDHTDDDQRIM